MSRTDNDAKSSKLMHLDYSLGGFAHFYAVACARSVELGCLSHKDR